MADVIFFKKKVLIVHVFSLIFDFPVFNLFTFVKFPNDDCVSQTQENGTCYTTDECRLRGGISSGYCAQGFGVCCLCTSFHCLPPLTCMISTYLFQNSLIFLRPIDVQQQFLLFTFLSSGRVRCNRLLSADCQQNVS